MSVVNIHVQWFLDTVQFNYPHTGFRYTCTVKISYLVKTIPKKKTTNKPGKKATSLLIPQRQNWTFYSVFDLANDTTPVFRPIFLRFIAGLMTEVMLVKPEVMGDTDRIYGEAYTHLERHVSTEGMDVGVDCNDTR